MEDEFHANVHSMGSTNRVYIDSDVFEYGDGTGDTVPIVTLVLDVGDEQLTIMFDAFHMREFRLAVQRADKWLSRQQ